MKPYAIHLMIAVLSVTGANAQNEAPKCKHRHAPPLLLPVLDTDKNGRLIESEIQNSSAALLELDKNDDGMLDRKEMAPRRKKGKNARKGNKNGKGKDGKKGKKPKRPHPSRIIISTLDLDEDRVLSADEIENAPLSLIELDRNGDGIITRRELKPGRTPRNEPT